MKDQQKLTEGGMRAHTAIHLGAPTSGFPRRSIKVMYAKRWLDLLTEEAQGLLGMVESEHALISNSWRRRDVSYTCICIQERPVLDHISHVIPCSCEPKSLDVRGPRGLT